MPARPLPSMRRSIIGPMLAAFALTQWLGIVHRAPHGPAAGAAQAQEAGALALGALFAHHQHEVDCKVFDHLACGDLAGATTVAILVAAAADTPVVAHGAPWQIVAATAGFLARGPPAQG